MSRANRVWLSLVIGWGFKAIPILLSPFFDESILFPIVAITNIDMVIGGLLASKFGGIGLMGYDEQGQSMDEGTPVLIVFLFIGFVSGIIIYPLIIFVILTIWNKFRANS